MVRQYIFPGSVEEAVDILNKNSGDAIVISGGTDLIIDIDAETVKADVLVDVTRISGFDEIRLEGGYATIGAAATMSDVSRNKDIAANVKSLAAAAGSVGSVQVRNAATLTGNIVKAQPAADSAVMLAALDAEITVCGAGGSKDIAVLDSYLGVGKSAVDSRKEVVSKIKFKLPEKNQGTSFVRLVQRKALALPMLNVGAMVSLKGGKIEWARIVMSPVGTKPTRAAQAESFLAGKEPSEENFKEAGRLAVKDANPRTSLIRGSKEYRLAVLPSLVARALRESVDEITAKGGAKA